jgi:hypothetical protein
MIFPKDDKSQRQLVRELSALKQSSMLVEVTILRELGYWFVPYWAFTQVALEYEDHQHIPRIDGSLFVTKQASDVRNTSQISTDSQAEMPPSPDRLTLQMREQRSRKRYSG